MGHLLQGRYKALLVDSENNPYFSTVSSYSHLNPARAKLFNLHDGALADYCWSRYPLYFDASKRPDWLCIQRVLRSWCFGADEFKANILERADMSSGQRDSFSGD